MIRLDESKATGVPCEHSPQLRIADEQVRIDAAHVAAEREQQKQIAAEQKKQEIRQQKAASLRKLSVDDLKEILGILSMQSDKTAYEEALEMLSPEQREALERSKSDIERKREALAHAHALNAEAKKQRSEFVA